MIEIRKFPWPYRAMLAICSDLDETPNLESYLTLSKFLNTSEETAIGRGIGIETGNTIYFDMAPGEFSYWSTSDAGRAAIHALIRSGHIDCFHSFGDLASTRAQVIRSLDALEQNDCRLPVWVDHAVAPTNLGRDIMLGHGDEIDAASYHADLTLAHGVRYVWLGRVSSCMGQDAPYSIATGLSQIRDRRSFTNTLKDVVKVGRGAIGDPKYALHWGNHLTRPYVLRDGQKVTEFMRCNPHPYGVSVGDDAAGFGSALQSVTLRRLIEREGSCVLYTHLGKNLSGKELLPSQTRKCLEDLSQYQRSGQILVTTTTRLLDYNALIRTVSHTMKDNSLVIDSHGVDASGLTFYGLQPGQRIVLNGQLLKPQWNPADHTARLSCSVPFKRLSYPL